MCAKSRCVQAHAKQLQLRQLLLHVAPNRSFLGQLARLPLASCEARPNKSKKSFKDGFPGFLHLMPCTSLGSSPLVCGLEKSQPPHWFRWGVLQENFRHLQHLEQQRDLRDLPRKRVEGGVEDEAFSTMANATVESERMPKPIGTPATTFAQVFRARKIASASGLAQHDLEPQEPSIPCPRGTRRLAGPSARRPPLARTRRTPPHP